MQIVQLTIRVWSEVVWLAACILKRWGNDGNKENVPSAASAIRQLTSAGKRVYPVSAGKHVSRGKRGKLVSRGKHGKTSRGKREKTCIPRQAQQVSRGKRGKTCAGKHVICVTCAYGNLGDSLFLLYLPCRWGRPLSSATRQAKEKENVHTGCTVEKTRHL